MGPAPEIRLYHRQQQEKTDMAKRVRPTEKYQEYQSKLDALHALIDAMLNDKLEKLEPLKHKDRLSMGRETTITQCLIMADWANEVRVYHIVEHADRTAK